MKKIYFSLSIILILITCCLDKKQTNVTDFDKIEEIRIDTEKGIKYPLDSMFSEKVWFAKLETINDNLIGEVSNIFFDDSLIFVVDAKQTKSVFIFNDKGKYLRKIARSGNGPGEYSSMYNVFLAKSKKEIIVVDVPQRKQIRYSYSGEFKSEDRYDFPSYTSAFLESGNKVYYIADLKNPIFENSNNNVLIVTNERNKMIYSACNEFKSETFGLFQQHKFWKYDDQLFFNPNFNDTLFLITDTAAIAKYHVNIIRDKIPHPSQIINITNDCFTENYLNKYSFFNGKFIELEDLTYLELENVGYKFIYSHKTKNTYSCMDPINSLYKFFRTPIARFNNNIVVEATLPTTILKYKQYFYENLPKIKEKHPDIKIIEIEKSFLDSLYNGLNEEDNPVLFFYELNKNL